MSGQALRVLEECDVIVGYPVYLKLLGSRFKEKEQLSTPMRGEVKRCRMCFEEASKGKKTVLICSGDAGVYGLASLMFEIGREYPDFEITVVPGITAANSGAAMLGAPLNNDYCVISLSDLLTPWKLIEKRLCAAADADFCITLYNPASHKRPDCLKKACEALKGRIEGERACGYVENIGREGTRVETCTFQELRHRRVNMYTTVFIGNTATQITDGKLVTPRGYLLPGAVPGVETGAAAEENRDLERKGQLL